MDQKQIDSSYHKALAWVKKNTLDEKGMVVTSTQRFPYLEVTGYLIPTLLECGEDNLAQQYAQFLSYMQRPNGSFAGPDGREYIFDTGQILRGLLAAASRWERFKPAAKKAADYLLSSMQKDGRLPAIYKDDIPEAVHVFVLPALAKAAEVLSEPRYLEAASRSTNFYKTSKDVLNTKVLTHFLGYIIDGFVDMGETEFVRKTVQEMFSQQKKNGAIAAYPHVSWVCSVGLAQFAIIGYKLGMKENANRAIEHLAGLQNPTGGFNGSYGRSAEYFQNEEISWANKFFLDALNLKGGPLGNRKEEIKPLDDHGWHEAMVEITVAELANKLQRNDFPLWCRPLLEYTKEGETVLETGSGTGELSAILSLYGRKMQLLDFSQESINYAKALFAKMKLDGGYHTADIRQTFPFETSSVDWVMSSGVLEHFTDDEVVAILKESMRVSKKGVMCLVPNSNALFYQIGKFKQEKEGSWAYGKEIPKVSMKPFFEAAGLKNICETSVGASHSLNFLSKNNREDAKNYLDSLNPQELELLNQGYLLFTCGEKSA